MPKKIGQVMLSNEEIQKKVSEIAEKVVHDHTTSLILITVLEGARVFCSDLIKEIHKISDITIDNNFIQLSSYGTSTRSSGDIRIKKDLDIDITGKDVMIVEDIVDTGNTLSFLKKYLLKEKKASHVRICTLLDKPCKRKVEVEIDYKGFIVPDEFIVGYGLDYAEMYRDLKDIHILVD